jgi:hypothetical protein
VQCLGADFRSAQHFVSIDVCSTQQGTLTVQRAFRHRSRQRNPVETAGLPGGWSDSRPMLFLRWIKGDVWLLHRVASPLTTRTVGTAGTSHASSWHDLLAAGAGAPPRCAAGPNRGARRAIRSTALFCR